MSNTWIIISLALCFSAIFFWLWMNQWTFYLSRASILNETNIKIQFFINVMHNTPMKTLLKALYTKYKRGRLMYSFWKYLFDQNLTTQEIKDVFDDIYPSDDMDQKVFFLILIKRFHSLIPEFMGRMKSNPHFSEINSHVIVQFENLSFRTSTWLDLGV